MTPLLTLNTPTRPLGNIIFSYKILETVHFSTSALYSDSMSLCEIARAAQGASGRRLRKLPFLAFAALGGGRPASLKVYLQALKTVASEIHGGGNRGAGAAGAGAAV
jgi:hypothetical protein